MIIANNKTIKEKTIELIDALKSTCQTYGMGNDGNEYKIITQVFLYKFINDKFGYEVKNGQDALGQHPRDHEALEQHLQNPRRHIVEMEASRPEIAGMLGVHRRHHEWHGDGGEGQAA